MTVLKFERPPANDDPRHKHPPMLNIPPLTLWTLIAIVVIQIAQNATPAAYEQYWYNLAFVPARYFHLPDQLIWAIISPIAHIFLHGGWMHVAMNGLMFMAFGAAAERMLGRKDAIILFLVCGLAGAATQFALAPQSPYPMIGASGALSGLFAAVIFRMQQSGTAPVGKWGIWGVAALWIGLSFVTALIGGAIGLGNVAWAAHAGGFIAGILMMKYVLK